jgi:hypothetical protein
MVLSNIKISGQDLLKGFLVIIPFKTNISFFNKLNCYENLFGKITDFLVSSG